MFAPLDAHIDPKRGNLKTQAVQKIVPTFHEPVTYTKNVHIPKPCSK